MSGIIGKLSFDRHETLARAVVEQMLDAVRHRGSRARGIYTAPGIAIGWCTDTPLPPRGPAVAADELHHVRVVADSALTNARELRARLERLGHDFTGPTDGEVMAHAYQEWGDGCVERFRGAFACAIWDERERRLLLARDQAGLRPLYFALLHGHGIVFGSEIRALLQDPGVGREWCATGIDAYLALGYVPAPLTAYRRISKLEAAQRLVVDGRAFRVDQYWDLPQPDVASTGEGRDRLAADAAVALEGTLRRVIARDTREHGVNAILYSGGLASSALLACDAAAAGDPVLIALDQDAADIVRAGDLARQLRCEPVLDVSSNDVVFTAQQLSTQFDEPIADPAVLAQYAICAAARAHADTAFAGHGAASLWAGTARRDLPGEMRLHRWQRGLDADDRRAIYTRTFAWEVRDANPFSRHLELYASRTGADAAERIAYVDARMSLPDNVLVMAERAALAAGLRLRFPFLDHAAIELAARVPAGVKRHGAGGPRVIRALLERHVPASMLPAVDAPASDAPLREAIAALVPPMLLAPRFDGRGIVSRPALVHLWDEHVRGRRNHTRRFWSLLMLEFWFRTFIDGDAAAEPVEYAVLKAA